jgi:hypothetical protein
MPKSDKILDVSEKVLKKIALRLADEAPFISEIKSKLDADISSKESGNQKQKVIDNCMLIQHIVAYLNTGNPEILTELNDVFSGVGSDGQGNRVVKACDLNDVSYREAIDDRISTIKKIIPKRKQVVDGNVPYVPTSEEFDNPERSDGRLVFHNPNILGAKTLKKHKKRKTQKKRKSRKPKPSKRSKRKSNKRKRLTTRR